MIDITFTPWHPNETMTRQDQQFQQNDLIPAKLGWMDASTQLLDFAIITYAIQPELLDSILPDSLEPDLYTLDNGDEVAFISAVPFQDKAFHFHFAPFIKVGMGQTNYRAYVRRRDGKKAVYFFGTTLSGFWVRVPRDIWKLPWKSAKIHFNTEWVDDELIRYHMTAESKWGPAELQMTKGDQDFKRLDGFTDQEESALVLTHPLIGYYHRMDGKLGSYSVWHKRLDLKMATVEKARFSVFERLGLITAESPVHSALVMRQTEFKIYLPPRLADELTEPEE